VGESTTGGACVSATEQRREIAPLSNGVSEEPTSSASWERVAVMAGGRIIAAGELGLTGQIVEEAIQQQANPLERAFWARRDLTIYDVSVTDFAERLAAAGP